MKEIQTELNNLTKKLKNYSDRPKEFYADPNFSFSNCNEYETFISQRDSASEYGETWKKIKACLKKLQNQDSTISELSKIDFLSEVGTKYTLFRFAVEQLPFINKQQPQTIQFVVHCFYLSTGSVPDQVKNKQLSILWHELAQSNINPDAYFSDCFPDFDPWSIELSYQNLF